MAFVYIRFGDDHSDIGGYHRDALAFFAPGAAARHLPPEYPPLALVPFSVTLIPIGDYGVLFVGLMAALFVGGYAFIASQHSRCAANAYAVYMLVSGPWTLLGRFDLVPSLVVLAAILSAGRGRWCVAYALLAAGVLLKLYPLFLVPLFLIEQWRMARPRDLTARETPAWPAAGPGLFGLIVLGGFAAASLADPRGWLGPIHYALQRPVQVESVPSTVLWLLSGLEARGRVDHSFNSVNVVAAGSGAVEAAALAVLAAGCVAIWAWQTADHLSLRQACLACLCLVIATNRVFSPQYLVWLLPLVAIELGLDPVWIGICILTFLVYPNLYSLAGLVDGQTATTFAAAFLMAIATRNGLFLVATWRAVRGPTRAGAPAAAA